MAAEASRRGTECTVPEQGVPEEEGSGEEGSGEEGPGLDVRKLVQLKELLLDSGAEGTGVAEGTDVVVVGGEATAADVPEGDANEASVSDANEASVSQEEGREVKKLARLKEFLQAEGSKEDKAVTKADSEHSESDEDGPQNKFARGAQRQIPEPSAEDLPFGPYEQDGTRERPFHGGDARSTLMRLARTVSKPLAGGGESDSDPSDASDQGDVGQGGESDGSTDAAGGGGGGWDSVAVHLTTLSGTRHTPTEERAQRLASLLVKPWREAELLWSLGPVIVIGITMTTNLKMRSCSKGRTKGCTKGRLLKR